MKKSGLLLLLVSISSFALADSTPEIKGGARCGMFQPIHASDSSSMKMLSIFNQEIKVDLYSGYAAVSADYWIDNSSEKNIQLAVGLPQEGNQESFSAFYWLRIVINHQEPFAVTDTMIGSHFKVWTVNFQPGVTEVNLFYGIRTDEASLSTGEKSIRGNCFRYDFYNDHFRKTDSERGEIWLRMNDGFTTRDVLGLLPDKKFLGGNSILHAWVKDEATDTSSQVLLWYRSIDSLPLNVSSISWEMKYNDLKQWNPDEKILRTLSAFSATDFEGKMLEEEREHAQTIIRLKWLTGLFFASVIIAAFIWSQRRKKPAQ